MFGLVLLVLADHRRLDQFRRVAEQDLSATELERVRCGCPDAVGDHLAEVAAQTVTTETIQPGRKVQALLWSDH